jgi:hypothetical protein
MNEPAPTVAHMAMVAFQFLDEGARDRKTAKHLAHYVLALTAEINDLRKHGTCRHGCSPCLVGVEEEVR